jgi:hypothetical protein
MTVLGSDQKRQPWGAAVRGGVLVVAGALPVLSISLAVFGVLPMTASARYLVVPFLLAAVVLVAAGSVESRRAVVGFLAGLVAVSAYDAVRMPLVFLHIWPDFIPRIGGWVLGTGHPDAALGYLWRYVGDGGGIGLVFFLAFGVLAPAWQERLRPHSVAVGVAYGIFVWTGLIATIGLSHRGPELLFPLTPTSLALSLLGHLIYGGVLGICLGMTHRRAATHAVGYARSVAPV